MSAKIEFFHGSHAEINEFWELTHFGTRKAAEQIIRVRNEREAEPGRTGIVYLCKVPHDEPIVKTQDPQSPKPGALLRAVYEAGHICLSKDPSEHAELARKSAMKAYEIVDVEGRQAKGASRYYRAQRKWVAELLREHGISLIEYKNEVEDIGSTSYVVVDPAIIERGEAYKYSPNGD